jgi:hypothetical protein
MIVRISPSLSDVTSPKFGGRFQFFNDFAAEATALEQGLDSLEDEAIRRAFEGSDRLLMYVLNRRRPEVYSTHRANSQVAGTTKHVIDFNDGRRLPKDDLQEIEDGLSPDPGRGRGTVGPSNPRLFV